VSSKGTLDAGYPPLILATTAAALDMEVGVFFTFFGLHILKQKGLDDVLLFGGGIIPDKDILELDKLGIGAIFTPGASTTSIIEYITKWVEGHRN